MGKVWLVGAGPSDGGLMTLKGLEALKKAQVVVYDALVGREILSMIPADAERIYVGKRAGRHTMSQEEISRLLCEKAAEGKRVVRLKGGDPFLFGRGGEELELLASKKIPFEIVPGVTSAIAVPAYGGIPVTHRDYASSVHIITGHRRAGESCDIQYKALVQAGGTLVFLMGLAALEEICRGLLAEGMEPDMPAALLIRGTTADQRRIVATVSTLPRQAAREQAATPAIIVVGRVCGLSGQFSWYENQPLFGHRILVTRPEKRSRELADRLRRLGAEVLELPAIKTVALEWELPENLQYEFVVFTSPAGVDMFFDRLKERRRDLRCLGGAKLAAIGPGTARELETRGLFADLMPEVYDGEHLGILLGERCSEGDRILIPRAKEGNPRLVEEICKRKRVSVTELATYETFPVETEILDQKALIEEGRISMVIFTSASAVRAFAAATRGLNDSLVRAVCIGRQTLCAAKELGMEAVMAKEATVDSLVECVVETAAGKRGP